MKKPSLLIIFLTVFIDLIGFGIVMPLLPRYSEKFGAEGFLIGMVISSFSVMQFIFAPWWGKLSDRIGRRPVLLVSNAGSAVSYALFAVAASFNGDQGLWILLLSRVFAGICGANISVASAYIADVTTPENRSKGMGMIGMAFGLGFILGPALGSFSAKAFGLAGPGWVAASLCAANFILGSMILVESRKPGAEPATPRPKFAQWRHTLSQPALALLITLFFLATFCFTCFETTLPLLLGSTKLHQHNLKDPAALIARLREGQDPVAVHLRTLASQSKLEFPSQPTDVEPLLNVLNSLLKSPDFYSEKVFGPRPVAADTTTPQASPTTVSSTNANANASAVSTISGISTAIPERALHENRLMLEKGLGGLLNTQRFYFDETSVGWLFAYCGLVGAFIQGGAIGRMVKKFGEVRLIWMSLIAVSLSLVLIPLAGGMAGLLVGLGIFAAGSGINRAPTMGLISSCSSADEQGANLGVAQSFGSLARIAGPLFATTLYARSVTLPYFICAGIALAAAVIAFLRLKQVRDAKERVVV